jgi:hypothetical protein
VQSDVRSAAESGVLARAREEEGHRCAATGVGDFQLNWTTVDGTVATVPTGCCCSLFLLDGC